MLRTLAFVVVLQVTATTAVDVPADLRAVAERFFAMQEAEDIEGYLALWSATAQRPQAQQLKYIFDNGDDRFSELKITFANVTHTTARVRGNVTRVRRDLRITNPDGSLRMLTTMLQFALSFVRENGEWKIVREGSPADELAVALLETQDAAARETLMKSDPELLSARLVDAIARRADPLAQTGRYKEAQQIYERALEVARAIGDRKAEGQAIQNVANSLYYQRNFAAAREMYERRLVLEREIANDEGIASALIGIATVRYSAQEFRQALELYREALAIQERLDDQLLIAQTLISTGNVLYLQGDYEASIADYRRAETLKRKFLDLPGAATALEGLGRVYAAQGDYTAALKAFSDVLEEHRKRNDVARQAAALQNIGDIHFRLANNDAARSRFEEARALFAQGKDVSAVGRVLQAAGLNELVAGRFAAGDKAYAESIASCEPANDADCVARGQLGRGFALAAQQRYEEAVEWYRKSIASFTALPAIEAAARARVALAEALTGKGDFEEAVKQAAEARHAALSLESDDLRWRALVAQARAERKMGKADGALGLARAALLVVRKLAEAALDRPGYALPRDASAAYATTAMLQAETGDAAGALVTVEEMRAHTLRNWIARDEREISRGMTDEERTQERALAAELTPLHAQREREKGLAKPDAQRLKRLDAAIADASARRRAFLDGIYARVPELRLWRGLGAPPAIDDATALVKEEGTILLELIADEHDVVILGAWRDPNAESVTFTASVVPVERQVVGERLARALDASALQDPAVWRKASAELFGLIPSAILDKLTSARTVLIVPDDLLWRVPFEAMPVATGYLSDRARVRYLPSIGALRLAEPATRPSSMVVVAAPTLDPQVVETLKTTAPTWTLRPAEHGDRESTAITISLKIPAPVAAPNAPESDQRSDASAQTGLTVLTSDAATVSRVRDALPAGILHIAAPFRINAASPLFSRVLLASNPTAPAEGNALEIREAFRLAGADAVLFSDPASLSMRDAPAALVAIDWAWRVGGARTLVVRRWGGEEAGLEFLGRFYTAKTEGRSGLDAFDAARGQLRQSERWRAPAAWAGWLVIGQ